MARLTEQQSYLLNRMPKTYDYRKFLKAESAEPARIVKARKLISDWERKQEDSRDAQEKKFESLLAEAREAVYFKPPEQALLAVKALEAKLRKKV